MTFTFKGEMSIIRNFNSKLLDMEDGTRKKKSMAFELLSSFIKKYLMKNLIFPKGVKVRKIRCLLNQFLQIVHYLVSKAEAVI